LEQQLRGSTRTAPAGTAEWRVELGFHSDRGRVRGNNEDNFLLFDLGRGAALDHDGQGASLALAPRGLVMAVADGMGGMNGGELASRICVETLAATLHEHHAANSAPWRAVLRDAVQRANLEIFRQASQDSSTQGMGTTLTAAIIEPGGVFIVQVGDSRCYLGRDRTLVQLTRDQTVWESMISAGREQPDGLEHAPWTNMLMQAVGSQPDLDEVTTEHDLQAGDWMVLCTDGLYRVVAAGDIAGVLHTPSSAPEKARALVALANERGGPDNVTTIVCQVNAK